MSGTQVEQPGKSYLQDIFMVFIIKDKKQLKIFKYEIFIYFLNE